MRLLYTGAFRYPDGDAAAHRVTSIASMFRDVGWDVTIAGWEAGVGSGSYLHAGFRCFSQNEFRSGPANPVSRLAGLLNRGGRTLRWLRSRADPPFDAIVAYNPPALFAARLRRFCATTGAVAVLDSTEWYEGSHLPGGRLGPAAVENWARMRLAYPRYQHVICISRMLERHFTGRNRNVVRIPPLAAVVDTGLLERPDPAHGLRLAYAGQAGRKDRFGALLRAIPRVASELAIPVRLVIAGMSRPELERLCAEERVDPAAVEPWTECLGRIDRAGVASLYRGSHFSVLFREDRRYAKAGFPTKAVESWSHGCPIICNPVGDLARIAEDGMDALFVEEEDLATALTRRLRQVIDERCHPRMVTASLAKARNGFSPEAYRAEFGRFASRLVPSARAGHVVGIDASRNRSGGAKVHLVGILTALDPREHGISEVHLWSYRSLLDAIPDAPWLVKHNPPELERSLARQIWWQHRRFPGELRAAGCSVVLTTDAGSVSTFRPSVVMSRDMLSFEPGEMGRYGFSRMWFRLLALKYVQARSLKSATGALFLTRYAADVIQRFTGPLPRVRVIPHGVGDQFRRHVPPRPWPAVNAPKREIRCIYVSNADLYKHQWHVITAIARLRNAGHPLTLTLVGGGRGPAAALIDEAVAREDPEGKFVTRLDAVKHADLPRAIAEADLFIFASSCENMPNTLVEGMAAGLPIACSDRGPMPEVLADGGVYFDPEDPASIAGAVERLLEDPSMRSTVAERAKRLSDAFSWRRCASETWAYLCEVASMERADVRQ